MKRIFFLLALVLIFSGCNDKNKIYVTGVIKDTKEKYIYINRLDVDTPILIDSAKIDKKGSFRLKFKASSPEFYQLGYSRSNFITLLTEPGEKINLTFNSKNLFENYSVKGSQGSLKLQILDISLADTKRKLDSLKTLYSKASAEPGFDVKKPVLESQYSDIIKAQRKKSIEFIINNVNSLASIKALYQKIDPDTYVLYDQHDLQYLKIVTDSLSHHYPNSKEVQALARDFTKEMNEVYASQVREIAKKIPPTKLDPVLKDINGKRVALSSLKGKYVLLTFWSFRSKECIAENLQLKELYKLYSKKGFEIYQINIDDNEEGWKAAVRFDELPWISTREDDPKNLKVAVLFNVTSLPANYLFDKESTIVNSNLHGRDLQLKLDQLFNK
jgi:thiol-disulfide isomerase/thioredoxin